MDGAGLMHHHYLPVCYLKRWSINGKLVEFCRKNGKVCRIRRPPTGTGFLPDLYKIEGANPEIAHVFETEFLKLVDDRGARALEKMSAPSLLALTPAEKDGWIHFILSLMVRTPLSVAAIRDIFLEQLAKDDRASTELNYRVALMTVKEIMLNRTVRDFLLSIEWGCIELKGNAFPLLTSDRPVLITNGLDKPNGQLLIPIGPRTLFCAVRNTQTRSGILSIPHRDLSMQINRSIVSQSVSYVYGSDDAQQHFIEMHMGKAPRLFYFNYRTS